MAGPLVIAGGNITKAEHDIFSRFAELGGGASGFFVLVPCATIDPEESFNYFRTVMLDLGVPEASVRMAEISTRKPGWERGAYSEENLALAEKASAFWFYGGNQNAVMDALQDEQGADTPFLAKLKQRHADGAVLGGSSAGAAIMSNPMIGGGSSFGALAFPLASRLVDTELSDPLYLRQGLGFFTRGIVDQHFDVRARSARLLRAMSLDTQRRTWGFGISEDTAMVWSRNSIVEVAGSAGVFIFDTRDARWQKTNNRFGVTDVVLHYLTSGDSLDLGTLSFDFAGKAAQGSGEDFLAVNRPVASGVLSPYNDLASFVRTMLLDNAWESLFSEEDADWKHAKSFLVGYNEYGERQEWEIRCKRKLEHSALYGLRSFINVGMDIIPI